MSESLQRPLHVLFVFIDGVGLGQENDNYNPLSQLTLPAFNTIAGGRPWLTTSEPVFENNQLFKPIDACLSVDGLPQSGTGQATLFTGMNCAEKAGRHFGPYPHSTSKPIIADHNIFSQVSKTLIGHASPNAFANAYPDRFFQHAEARNRWTVTTLSCIEGGVPIRTQKELDAHTALTADITGRGWKAMLNPDTEVIDEAEAARRLVAISAKHPFTLYEYYLTDKAGHSQNPEKASKILFSLDRFFQGLLDHIDFTQTLLITTSDHGNLEDLSTKSHTFNEVPLIAKGRGASTLAKAESIQDVTPAILETLRTFNSTSLNIPNK